jgi:hypothetical protein
MRDDTGTWLGGAVRVAAAFLLAGAGLATTTAVALVAVPGEAATAVVTVAPFLLAPPLAAAAGLTLTRGDIRTAALGGGLGSLVGAYVLGAFALGTLVGIGQAGGVTGLVVPLLAAGLPTAVVGAGSGYLGARGDEEPAPVATETAPEGSAEPNDVPTTADGGSEPLTDADLDADLDAGGGRTAMSAPTDDDPSPGEVDIDAWADDDGDDDEIEDLDDLFEKTGDPVAKDGD